MSHENKLFLIWLAAMDAFVVTALAASTLYHDRLARVGRGTRTLATRPGCLFTPPGKYTIGALVLSLRDEQAILTARFAATPASV